MTTLTRGDLTNILGGHGLGLGAIEISGTRVRVNWSATAVMVTTEIAVLDAVRALVIFEMRGASGPLVGKFVAHIDQMLGHPA